MLVHPADEANAPAFRPQSEHRQHAQHHHAGANFGVGQGAPLSAFRLPPSTSPAPAPIAAKAMLTGIRPKRRRTGIVAQPHLKEGRGDVHQRRTAAA